MENKFKNLIELGQKSKTTSSNFDVVVSQLITTLVLNSDKGVDFQFAKDGNSLKLEIIDTLSDNSTNDTYEINLATRMLGIYQLTSAASRVFRTLKSRGLEPSVNTDQGVIDNMLKDSIISYHNLRESSLESDVVKLNQLEDNRTRKLIQLNAFRKMFSNGGKNVSATSERALALSIIAINYFMGGSKASWGVSQDGLDDETFYKKVSDIEFLDKVLIMGLQDNYDLTNFMCGRSRGADRATSYLSAYNLNDYNNSPTYGSNSVRVDDVAMQMMDKTDYMI